MLAGAVILVVGGWWIWSLGDDDPVDSPEEADAEPLVEGEEADAEPLVEGEEADAEPLVEGEEADAEPLVGDDETVTAGSEPVSVGLLNWEMATEIDASIAVGVVEFADAIWVFAGGDSESQGWLADGLKGWRSEDGGLTWTEQDGGIVAGNRVVQVVVGDDALLAVGRTANFVPALWRSDDGLEWTHEALPIPVGFDRSAAMPTQIAEAEGTMVIVGSDQRWDVARSRIVQAAKSKLGIAAESIRSLLVALPTVRIGGPFGLRLWEGTLADLELTNDDLASLSAADAEVSDLVAWTSSGDGWDTSLVEGSWPQALTPLPDSGFSLLTSGFNGVHVFTTFDGTEWNESADIMPNMATQWRGSVIGSIDGPTPVVALVDDSELTTVDLSEILGSEGQPSIRSLAAGDGGVAVAVTGFVESSGSVPELPLLIHKGYTLVADNPARVRLRIGDEDVYAGPILAGIQYTTDLTAGTLTFLDPLTSEDLVAFPIDDLVVLAQVRQASYSQLVGRQSDVLFSADLVEWHRNTVGHIIGDPRDVDTEVVKLHIGGDRLIALTRRQVGSDVLPFQAPVRQAPLVIYSAPLP